MLELIQRQEPAAAPPGAPAGASAAAAAAGSSSSSMQIALFSLGNLCAHGECADALARLGLEAALAAVLRGRGGDATVQRYVQRIQAKVQARRQATAAA